jgi:hypothetical protein
MKLARDESRPEGTMERRDDVRREVLPIPDRKPVGLTTYDAKDPGTKFPPIQPLRPPTGAPNVLIILLDDVGFGASSAFGGPCHTPTAERLATQGLKYTRFHHFGGTRNGAIVHWPKGFTSRGELRSQFHHVIQHQEQVARSDRGHRGTGGRGDGRHCRAWWELRRLESLRA